MSSIIFEKNEAAPSSDKLEEHENDTEEVSTQGAAEHETELEPATTDANFPSSQNPATAETEPSYAAGSKPKQKRKPRAKRELTEKELAQRRKAAKSRAKTLTKEHQIAGGKALARKRGSRYMQEMGTKGGEIARKRHPDLPERGGEANWERIKRLRAERKAQEEEAKLPEPDASNDSDTPDIKPKPASSEANDN